MVRFFTYNLNIFFLKDEIMQFMKMTAALMVMAASSASWAAAPDAAQVKAVQDMLVSLQAEKMMRQTAGASRYSNEEER